jgi:site-specific DNA-methyltransferase (adenine-specific)
MLKERLARIDGNDTLRNELLPYCRMRYGQIWEDPECGHRVACLDATDEAHIGLLVAGHKATLAVQDPPYNVAVGNVNSTNLGQIPVQNYVDWSRTWVSNTSRILSGDASLYVWLGADQNAGFQPLADFIVMMRAFTEFRTRSLITMRNQRGYGTQNNWMAVRQELLYYTRGQARFNVDAEYTDIPKILRGYYKKVNGQITENLERSRSENIRAGNVWVDIQQVFYRMDENVPGCYAQKPLKAIERIIAASSNGGEIVVDFFAHSGTTLLGCERLKRRCFTCDIDPVFAEITLRRLERYRKTGETGWQSDNPFPEVPMAQERDENDVEPVANAKIAPQSLFDQMDMGSRQIKHGKTQG